MNYANKVLLFHPFAKDWEDNKIPTIDNKWGHAMEFYFGSV